jgi:hypothetical protein
VVFYALAARYDTLASGWTKIGSAKICGICPVQEGRFSAKFSFYDFTVFKSPQNYYGKSPEQ